MNRSRIAVVEGHNKHEKTDHLYEPLRKALYTDTSKLKQQLQQASQFSHVSHRIKTHTYQQNIQLGQHTLIPEYARLKPTHNTWKINKNHTYYIINTEQKLHEPISQQQMQRILQNQRSEQVIVYTIGEEDSESSKNESVNELWNQIVNENNIDLEKTTHNFKKQYTDNRYQNVGYMTGGSNRDTYPSPIAQRFNVMEKKQLQTTGYYTRRTDNRTDIVRDTYINTAIKTQDKKVQDSQQKLMRTRQSQYQKQHVLKPLKPISRKKSKLQITQKAKYNLFSAIDEPINNLLSGKSCTCPANTIVAQELHEISWYAALKS